jgi:TM2 domain-containing membrane protein YozV
MTDYPPYPAQNPEPAPAGGANQPVSSQPGGADQPGSSQPVSGLTWYNTDPTAEPTAVDPFAPGAAAVPPPVFPPATVPMPVPQPPAPALQPVVYPPISAQPYPPPAPAGYPYPGLTVDPLTGQPLSDKSKTVAGLLQLVPGFLLGLNGIGRLYAGQTTLGVIQLVATVVGWICFWCGFLLAFPFVVYFGVWLWAVIDGIILLAGRPVDGQGRLLRA